MPEPHPRASGRWRARASTRWCVEMRVPMVVVAVFVTAACAASGGKAGTAAGRTVEFTLVAGKTGANGTLNFNGYARGMMTVTVPAGWRVVVHYRNGSALRHSFDVIPYTGKQPDNAPPPVFAGASTKDLVSGIGVGREETISFVAGRPGKYEFLCGVLGHALAGMWDYLVVLPDAVAPTVRPAAATELWTR